ncbi:alpha/beta hydrolase [Trinickia dabaoshanensis]|uniref:Alpha/beta hydrolase n=1 Tax=Trinickia dabaoshanensis TaxID=564714 RepID=A0A2N7W2M6_9BURK|nr:alpha/beta fold hydrolase [Trinickia dabaoshanensis]PMS23658.1 alpha/beta hydrolase [Trinickia dabaoshanensis]
MQATPSRAALPRRSWLERLGMISLKRDELVRRHGRSNSRFLSFMGARVHYLDEGASAAGGAPIVLLHGFGASLDTWDGVAADLAREHRVIRVDLPPFGITGPLRSASGEIATMDLPAYRAFIDAFVAALGIEERATFVGNSLGGLIAWDYALRHPKGVDKLVLVDAAGFRMRVPKHIALFTHPLVRLTVSHCMPDAFVTDAIRSVYGDPAQPDAATLRRYADFFHGEGTREAVVKMVPTLDFAALDVEALARLHVPTLVLWGGKDRWIPLAHANEFVRRIRGARSVVYPELGHIPMEEAPARVLADLHAFFERTTGAALGVAG